MKGSEQYKCIMEDHQKASDEHMKLVKASQLAAKVSGWLLFFFTLSIFIKDKSKVSYRMSLIIT